MSTPSIPARFEVLSEVASTDAEVLLRVQDTFLEREVFLKCPGPGLAQAYKDRDLAETVLREARALARVRHPGVVGLIDVCETDDGPLLVLEPMAGETLKERMAREGRLDPSEVIEMGVLLASALEAVHKAGIVHRAISSECIALGADGRASLTGFHFAKAHAGSGLVSMASLVYGDEAHCPALPEHPAPEQYQGESGDARCDLFSLSWVLFECLTGEAPFEGCNPFLWTKPKDAGALAKEAPRGLVRALASCLAPEASRRLEDASALRRALEACRAPSDSGAGVASPAPASRRMMAGIAGAVVVVVAALGYALSRGSGGGDRLGDRGLEYDGEGNGSVAGHQAGEDYAPTFRSSYALLIGVGQAYEGTGYDTLNNTIRDIRDVGARLEELGWKVEMLAEEEATEENILQSFSEFNEVLDKDDQFLVWFAGHGQPSRRSDEYGWIIPAGSPIDTEHHRIRFTALEELVDELPAKHKLVALDACYSGRLGRKTRSVAVDKFFQDKFVKQEALRFLVSARGDETAEDGPEGGNSPFAKAFLDELGGKGPVTSSQIYAGFIQAFGERGRGQVPEMSGSGEFVFFLDQ